MRHLRLLSVFLFLTACVHAPEFQKKEKKVSIQKINQEIKDTQENTLMGSEMKVGDLDVTVKEAELVEELPKPAIDINDLLTVPPQGQKLVQKWLDYFQGRGRHHMDRYLSRLGRYEKYMTDILIKEGLPKELIYVALIESGFNKHAHSHASAVGYWQFIRGTGRGYGLTINSLVDERKNPRLATEAAAQYFKALYQVFGSWPLALSSYNAGENRVMRSVMRNYTRDFWTLALNNQLPKETSNYFPKFVAAAMIGRNPNAYGFGHIQREPELEYDNVVLTSGVSLSKMASNLGVPLQTMKDLNPSFRTDFVPIYKGSSIELRVPKSYGEKGIVAARESVSKSKYYAYEGNEYHRVRRGDSLYRIARRYGTSVSQLQRLNNFSRRSLLRPGMKVRLPGSTGSAKTYPVIAKRSGAKFHRIRRGDTLTGISRRYGVRLSNLAKMNGLSTRARVKIGQTLRIP